MKIKFPLYVPYPLAWLRLLINLIALCGMVIFIEKAWENNVNITHPFFWILCLLVLSFIGFIAHYPVRAILIRMGGISSISMIDSLWEGVLLIMVTVSSFLFSSIVTYGLYYELIINSFVYSSSRFRREGQDLFSQTDPPMEAWLFFLLYCVLALYLYHLEYLARQPHSTIAPKTAAPQKKSPKFKPSKPTTPPLTPEQKRDQQIDQEIDRLKKKIENQERFGK